MRPFDRFSFGEICFPTPPGNPRREHGDRERRNKSKAVKRPCDRVVGAAPGACAHSLAYHGSDIGIGCALGEKPDKGREGKPPERDSNESRRIADKTMRDNRRHPADQDHPPAFRADSLVQSSEFCAATELSLHPAPRQISACKKIDHSSDGRTDGDQSRTEPEAVNGARANRKHRTRQKKYASQRVKNMNHTTPIHPLCSIHSIEWWRNSVRPISADADSSWAVSSLRAEFAMEAEFPAGMRIAMGLPGNHRTDLVSGDGHIHSGCLS